MVSNVSRYHFFPRKNLHQPVYIIQRKSRPIGLLLQLFRVKEEVWELRSAGIWHKRERVREKKKRWEVRMRGQGRGRRDPDSFTLFPVVADGSTTTSTVQQAKKDKPPPPPVRFPNKQKPTPIKLEARHPFRTNKILS